MTHIRQQLKERGISLHMVDLGGDVTGNGIFKLVFTILSAAAEAERDRIRERVRDVKRDQKERSRFLGGAVPFGMELAEDGSLVPDPIAQAAIATMREACAAGSSLRQCAEMVRERHGLEVSHMTVKRVLRPNGWRRESDTDKLPERHELRSDPRLIQELATRAEWRPERRRWADSTASSAAERLDFSGCKCR